MIICDNDDVNKSYGDDNVACSRPRSPLVCTILLRMQHASQICKPHTAWCDRQLLQCTSCLLVFFPFCFHFNAGLNLRGSQSSETGQYFTCCIRCGTNWRSCTSWVTERMRQTCASGPQDLSSLQETGND